MLKLNNEGRAMTSSEKILLTVLLVVCVGFLYWIILLKPIANQIAPISQNVAELQEKVDAVTTIKSRIEEKEANLEELQGKYDEATKVIPRGDRYPEVIREVRTMAEANSIEIVGAEYEEPKAFTIEAEGSTEEQSSGLNYYVVALGIKGVYPDLLEFIEDIENDKRISSVSYIKLADNEAEIQFTYFMSGTEETGEYDFNTGSYGQEVPYQFENDQ